MNAMATTATAVVHDRSRLRNTMAAAGLEEVRFRFDFEGTKVVLS